jgi:membrane dipeptidase
MFIADAHLDLAYNALRGRDLLKPAAEQTPDDEGTPSVGLPDLARGGVGLICATLFCEPASRNSAGGYNTPEEAHQQALRQLDWYDHQIAAGHLQVVQSASDLPNPQSKINNHKSKMILLMEGADPIRNTDDVAYFFNRGVRIVALAWKQTRYAGGTRSPGPLTPAGRELVPVLDRHGIIHDLSHLAEQSFWDLLELGAGPVMASHSNCRAIVPTDRQLSDEMIQAIIKRKGVIGINFYDRFLIPPDEQDKRRGTLADVVRHMDHIRELAGGDTRCIGIGTDMDGGFGRERIPVETPTIGELARLADTLAAAGYSDRQIGGIMGENWRDYFAARLAL